MAFSVRLKLLGDIKRKMKLKDWCHRIKQNNKREATGMAQSALEADESAFVSRR
jgi:hypothetical protein